MQVQHRNLTEPKIEYLIKVTDSGNQMQQFEHSKFDKYSSTVNLGLSVCKQIANSMGGDLYCEPENQGMFIFKLNLERAPVKPRKTTESLTIFDPDDCNLSSYFKFEQKNMDDQGSQDDSDMYFCNQAVVKYAEEIDSESIEAPNDKNPSILVKPPPQPP